MRVTDIDAKKADVRSEDCLHCVVADAIEDFYRRRGERVNGMLLIDVAEVTSKLTECIVEVIREIPDRSKRRRAMRMAHDALDANLKSQISGKLVEIDIPHEH
jgi:hypothetical protein